MESKKRNIINIDLSGCKNMKECTKAIDMISSGKIKITIGPFSPRIAKIFQDELNKEKNGK